MLFYLNVIKNDNRSLSLFSKFKNMFLFNSMDLNLKKYKKINIMNINVTLRRKKLNWKKIVRILGDNKKILCEKNFKFPKDLNICRYESNKLNAILCKNAVLKILKISEPYIDKEKFKVVIYDPFGRYFDFLGQLIAYFRNIVVITDNKENYTKEQINLLREFGVSILITDNRDWTYNSNLIISPGQILEPLQVSFNSIVFTSKSPKYHLNGRIYDKYEINSDNDYIKLKPFNLDDNYFLNVIYDYYDIKELENYIPEFCYYFDEKISLEKIRIL